MYVVRAVSWLRRVHEDRWEIGCQVMPGCRNCCMHLSTAQLRRLAEGASVSPIEFRYRHRARKREEVLCNEDARKSLLSLVARAFSLYKVC